MQMNNPNPRHGVAASLNTCSKLTTVSSARFLKSAACGVLLLALLAASAQAVQVVRIVASPIGVTVPLNATGTAGITNAIHVGGGSNAVNFSVSGLPSGVSYSFDTSSVTADYTNHLTLTFNSPPPQGLYNVSINAQGGATNHVNILLQVGNMWTGTYQTTGNWSSSSSWVSGHVPGPTNDVLFTDLGAQTNIFTNSLGATIPNSIVDGNFTISSLRFSNVTNDYHILQIPTGNTLSILGTNGFSFLRDDINLVGQMYIQFIGGGNMVVSNKNANIALLIENQQENTLDMSDLNHFTAYVNRMGIGDYSLYPNYYNYRTNEYGNSAPRRFVPTVFLARTNIIRGLYVDPYNYTNSEDREYAICSYNSYSQGTTERNEINLGISNVFYADGACFSHANEGGYIQFNRSFRRFTNVVNSVTNYITNSMVAIFRGTNGGRMSMFAVSDGGTPGPAVSNIKGWADFTDGTVDILADQFDISRDMTMIASNQTPNVQGHFWMSRGIVDVNTAHLGYQQFTNRYTNPPQDYRGYCEADLVVSNTATFIVHGTLTMGYTTETDPNAEPGENWGRITLGPGGSLSANKIVVDGGANQSSGNSITINSGADLIVSNTLGGLGGTDGHKLDTMTVNSGALTLFINAASSTPYAYVTNLNSSDSDGPALINIARVTNFTPPTQVIQLVQYDAGTPSLLLGDLPSGYSGILINNGAGNTIDLYLSTATPKFLVWRGYQNNNWDTTSTNWLDLSTGLHTNFATLDHVYFDDAGGVPTNINLVGTLTPGLVTMTNNTHNYIIGGGGNINGAITMSKAGTGTLDIEGTTTLSIDVLQGLLTGSGTISGATVESGGTMLYSGTVSANVVCAGEGTSSGIIQGSVTVQSGGVFTNLNVIYGRFVLKDGSFMKNAGSISFPLGYTANVNSNAFLLNLGSINGDLMVVDGTLEDDSSPGITMTQVTIGSSGTFIPGGTGIGDTYIYANGNGTTSGRLTLSSGSQTVIKVNPGSSANTHVWTSYLDYGPSQSGQDQNGGTLLISNVGGAFAAGQVFDVFGNSFFNLDAPNPTGSSTNSYPKTVPASPGPGLSWNLSTLWPNGVIGVINTPVEVLTNSFVLVNGTNMVSTFSWSTNAFNRWVLETQANPLRVGLSTNWSRVPGSWTNTDSDLSTGYKMRIITNSILTSNSAVFYRLVFP